MLSRLHELISPIEVVYDKVSAKDVDVVIGHHETIDCIKAASDISNILNVRKVLVLQLPPFYGNSIRRKKIEDAYMLYIDMVRRWGDGIGYVLRFLRKEIDSITERPYIKTLLNILNSFDVVLAVSKSIEIDMGFTLGNMVSLKCGIGFDEDEIAFLRSFRGKKSYNAEAKKDLYAVYSARLSILKGVVEALLATSYIKKSLTNFKLIITGYATKRALTIINKLIKHLGLKDNVVIAGFLPKAEAIKLKGNAKVSIYPSHVDAHPYSVAEALIMGTPVVGYRIPALTLNYGDISGLYLVDEGDIEALAQKTLEVFEMKKVKVEEPRICTLNDVVREEIEVLRCHV
ncbi:MAG: glycosyltransferase [Nitrososphaerota archaeon]